MYLTNILNISISTRRLDKMKAIMIKSKHSRSLFPNRSITSNL